MDMNHFTITLTIRTAGWDVAKASRLAYQLAEGIENESVSVTGVNTKFTGQTTTVSEKDVIVSMLKGTNIPDEAQAEILQRLGLDES